MTRKELTISVDEELYDALHRVVGGRNISRYIADLLESDLMDSATEEGYRAMADDTDREQEALEWCNGLIFGGPSRSVPLRPHRATC
jgi:hypothetical protein